MADETIRYYLIRKRIPGKKDDGRYFVFRNGIWEPDGSMITDLVNGYDPFEPECSPYRFGNLSVMDEIEEITSAEADLYLEEKQ